MNRLLNAKTYLESVRDTTVMARNIIITPLEWLALKLLPQSGYPSEGWKTNGAKIYRAIHFGENLYDLIICLPGASMAVITLEEAVVAGACDIVFLGSGASINGRNAPGTILIDGKIISVLNPFMEHEQWNILASCEAVDMEVVYLRDVAKKRRINFRDAIVITDHIWKDRWENLTQTTEYAINFEHTIAQIKGLLKGGSPYF